MTPSGTWPVISVIDFSLSDSNSFSDMNILASSLLFTSRKEFMFAGVSTGFKTQLRGWTGDDDQTFVFKWDSERQTSATENCLITNDEISPMTM